MIVPRCGLLGALALAGALAAQPPLDPGYVLVPVDVASGRIENTGPAPAAVWSEILTVPWAGSVQVVFDRADFGGDEDRIVLSGVQDGEVQRLDRFRLKQWRNLGARFNGPQVVVTLHLAPGSSGEVVIREVRAGIPPAAPPESICGPFDDRLPSADARTFRIAGCTGWLINDRSTFLSAGHCGLHNGIGFVAEFNVPWSLPNGATVAPPVQDQFPLDVGSVLYSEGWSGTDWAVARLHPNINGQTASARQGWFTLAAAYPATGTTMRVTGFGADTTPDPTYNAIQQTATGPLMWVNTEHFTGFQVDIQPGNSGGPLMVAATGVATAIVTHSGCGDPPGSSTNKGTGIFRPELQAAIAQTGGCGSAHLAAGVPVTLPCTSTIVDLVPAPANWNVVAVSSPSDWDLRVADAGSAAGGGACDFVLANGHVASVAPVSGQAWRYAGSDPGTAQYTAAIAVTPGQPAYATWAPSDIVRAFEFQVPAAAAFRVAVNGDPSLAWALYAPGADGRWRPRSSATMVSSGAAGAPPLDFGLSTGWHALIVFRDGGPGAPPSPLSVSVCPSAPVLALSPGAPATTSAACLVFSLAAAPAKWNVVGISSPSDWDLMIGGAVSIFGGASCDFAAANGNLAVVYPQSGVVERYSGTGAATVEHRPAVTIAPGVTVPAAIDPGGILQAFEFQVPSSGAHDIMVNGDGTLAWHLLAPGPDAAWRARSAAIASGVADGAIATVGLGPGWHVLVAVHDGGPVAASTPFAVTVGAHVAPLAFWAPGVTLPVTVPFQPFAMAPAAGAWNAMAVSSSSDWDISVGAAVSRDSGPAADFVVADGHAGGIAPAQGLLVRYSGAAPAQAQLAARTAFNAGGSATLSLSGSDIAAVFEVLVASPGLHEIGVSGPGAFGWRLFPPSGSPAWRPRGSALLSGSAGGPAAQLVLGAGWHAVVVTRDGGPGASSVVTVSVAPPNPVPVLASVNPSSAAAGTNGLNVTLLGGSFVSGAYARWNGAALISTVVHAGRIDATILPWMLASTGVATITVANPAPGGGISNGLPFQVVNPVPAIGSLAPPGAVAGGPSFTLSVNGATFVAGASVTWNDTPLATTFVSATQLQAQVPASRIAAPGVGSVRAVNPAPGGGPSPAAGFPVYGPHINDLTPPSIMPLGASSPPVTVTIDGLYFLPGSVVFGNGMPLPTTFVNAGRLTALVGPSLPQARLPGGICLNVQNAVNAVSWSAVLPVGTGHRNWGTLRRHPLAPLPGEPYAAVFEACLGLAPLTAVLDAGTVIPVTGWPTPAAEFVLAVSPLTGSAGPFVPFLDGIGLFGPPDGTAPDITGLLFVPGLVVPNPLLGLNLTVQAAFLDPSSPVGFDLTWARFPEIL